MDLAFSMGITGLTVSLGRNILAILLSIPLVVGCVPSVQMKPVVTAYPGPVEVLVRGHIIYDGKDEYLPRTVVADTMNQSISIHYTYDADHVREDGSRAGLGTGVIQLAGWTRVSLRGQLKVLDGTTPVKTYEAIGNLTMKDSEISDSLSHMRHRVLLAVRENIEAQMYGDKDFLRALSGRHATAGTR